MCLFADTPMQQYMSVFSQNGSSGYVQRPQVNNGVVIETTLCTVTLFLPLVIG